MPGRRISPAVRRSSPAFQVSRLACRCSCLSGTLTTGPGEAPLTGAVLVGESSVGLTRASPTARRVSRAGRGATAGRGGQECFAVGDHSGLCLWRSRRNFWITPNVRRPGSRYAFSWHYGRQRFPGQCRPRGELFGVRSRRTRQRPDAPAIALAMTVGRPDFAAASATGDSLSTGDASSRARRPATARRSPTRPDQCPAKASTPR